MGCSRLYTNGLGRLCHKRIGVACLSVFRPKASVSPRGDPRECHQSTSSRVRGRSLRRCPRRSPLLRWKGRSMFGTILSHRRARRHSNRPLNRSPYANTDAHPDRYFSQSVPRKRHTVHSLPDVSRFGLLRVVRPVSSGPRPPRDVPSGPIRSKVLGPGLRWARSQRNSSCLRW